MNYLTLYEAADLLAGLLGFDEVTAGSIDTALTQTIGVYQREPFVPRECIGVESSYEVTKLRILIHWSNNPTAAEQKAAETAELIRGLRNTETSDHVIIFTDIKAVRAIGKDEKGICEYVVDTDITYSERNDN